MSYAADGIGDMVRRYYKAIPCLCLRPDGGDYMDAASITSLIGSLGFPIVCCIALFYMLKSEQDSHKEETESLKASINELRQILTELYTYLKTVNGGAK